MSEDIKEINKKIDEIRSLNKLFIGQHSVIIPLFCLAPRDYIIVYNWRTDEYTIRGKGKQLNIEESRLNAFGVYLRHNEITNDLMDKIIDLIENYENSFPNGQKSIFSYEENK